MTAVVLRADARSLPLPDASVDLICCSPPYFGLRSYTDNGEHYEGQIGSEATPGEWLANLVDCTREWVRVLKPSGSIFVNLGDKYAGADAPSRHGQGATGLRDFGPKTLRIGAADRHIRRTTGAQSKCLLGLPWRYALACTDQLGLILRAEIIWAKPNGLPESVTDRVRRAHEQVFHLVKQPRYYSAVDEIREEHAAKSVYQRDAARRNPNGHLMRRAAATGQPQSGMAAGLRELHALGALPGSVWSIPSQPLTVPPHLGVDHFAAFPMELPRRIIRGWSPPGICVACGEGRRPMADCERLDIRPGYSKTHNGTALGIPQSGGTKWKTKGQTDVTIIGYACACGTWEEPWAPRMNTSTARAGTSAAAAAGATLGSTTDAPPTRPALVLDPFGGTGTTALVADMLGRHGISIDRSWDYTRLAKWRTTDPAERARALGVPKPPPVPAGQVSLFDLDGEASLWAVSLSGAASGVPATGMRRARSTRSSSGSRETLRRGSY